MNEGTFLVSLTQLSDQPPFFQRVVFKIFIEKSGKLKIQYTCCNLLQYLLIKTLRPFWLWQCFFDLILNLNITRKIFHTRASRLSTRKWEKKCERLVAPPIHFHHLLTKVPKCSYFILSSEFAIIFAHFFFGLAAIEQFVSKKSQKCRFLV